MWKLTLQDIYMRPKEPKTERDCSHRQLFSPFWGSSVWRNNQRKLWWKKSVHSDFSPDLELSIPTESRHTTCILRGKSPSVKLMSRRENKGLAIFKTIKCTTLFAGTLCLCEVSRFLSKWLTDHVAAASWIGGGRRFRRGPSGQAHPLPSRVSLSRAHSFLRPPLPSACYAGYCKMAY